MKLDVTFCDVLHESKPKHPANSQECEVQTGNHLKLKLLFQTEMWNERLRSTGRNI